jgi:hypothetical protein
LRSDRPNRVSRRRTGGAVALAAACAAVTLASACTTGTSDPASSSSDTSSAPDSSSTPTLPTATLPTTVPTDTGLPTALPTGATTSTSAAPSTTTSTPPPSTSRPPATVGIHLSFYDWSAAQQVAEVGANVEGKVIRNGSCTLTMRRGSVTRTASHKAVIAPSSTSCGVLTIPGSKLTPGAWTAVVTFTSPTATGSSDPVTITVTR